MITGNNVTHNTADVATERLLNVETNFAGLKEFADDVIEDNPDRLTGFGFAAHRTPPNPPPKGGL